MTTVALRDAAVVAGGISTVLFMISQLPMLVKAARTRDLSSYSVGNLAVANVGNLVHTLYVVSLPVGPIWLLHGFYLGTTALMLCWWVRYRESPRESTQPERDRPSSYRSAAHSP